MRIVFAVLTLVIKAQAGNIIEELNGAGATTLLSLIEKAGLTSTLEGEGPFTVFAPDNMAIDALPTELVDALMADTELLKTVLLNHVVAGQALSTDLSNEMEIEMVGGAKLRANIYLRSKFYDGFVTINGKRVKKADHMADNGVIHILTNVIADTASGSIAEVVTGDARFSTLLNLVVQAGLAETLTSGGPFTVFAPTNEAFSKLPQSVVNSLLADTDALKKVLLRHVVPGTLFKRGISWTVHNTAGGAEEDMIASQVYKGGVVMVVSNVSGEMGKATGARVVQADVLATNGVIHAIDTVI